MSGMRWLAYARLSKEEQRRRESENVGIQLAECATWAAEHGDEILASFKDDGISASRHSRQKRVDFERMVAIVKGDGCDGILCTEVQRLYRRPRELESLIELAEAGMPFVIQMTNDNRYDLGTSDGVRAAREHVAAAAYESDKIAERTRRKKGANARSGKFDGGGRPYGYERDGVTVVEAEAALIREWATALLSGQSLKSMVDELNRNEVPTTTGRGRWRPGTIRPILQSTRVIGMRSHTTTVKKNGKLVEVTNEYPAQWPAILDREVWDRVQVILNAEERYKGHRGPWGTYLLTGLVYCECGLPVIGAAKRDRPGLPVKRRYVCRKTTYNPNACGKMGRLAEPVEAFVTEYVLAVFASPEFASRWQHSKEPDVARLLGERQQLTDVRDDLIEDHTQRMITCRDREQRKSMQADLARQLALVDGKVTEVNRQLERAAGARVFTNLPPGASILEAWNGADVHGRRGLMRLAIERVVLLGGGQHPGMRTWPAADSPGFERAKALGGPWYFIPESVQIKPRA